MRRSLPLLGVVLLASALVVAACADGGPIAPPARPALDLAAGDTAEAPPDSGELILYPVDGPGAAGGEGAEGAFGIMAVAAASGPNIRIGVIQTATSVTLGSAAAFTVIDKPSGVTLFTGTAGSVTVTLASVIVSYYRLQVMCASTSAVNARKAAAEALGHPTLTEFVPAANCTRLYIGQLPASSTFTQRSTYRNLLISQGLAGTDSFYRLLAFGTAVYRVTNGVTTIDNVNPVGLTSADGLVTIGGVSTSGSPIAALVYRGTAEAHANSTGSLAGVNVLPVEQYLYGVVPRELGPTVFPEVEAQKAQAVAARTFAVAGFGRRGSDGYDLRATVDDQVYGGYAAEHPVSNAAVDATAGVVATHDGRLISANFSSTSGGHTANNEESFNGLPEPYLRGVPDSELGAALEHVPTLEVFKAHPSPTSLRAMRAGDFETNWARLHRWTFEWTMQEMASVISDIAPQPVGAVLEINVLARGPSGRVLTIEYVTDVGTFTSAKGAIRSSLRFFDAAGGKSNLPSTLFFIEPVRDPSTKELVGYRAYGGGFGHGVGLAQTGAVGMAQRGHTYEQILTHYYQGIELTTLY